MNFMLFDSQHLPSITLKWRQFLVLGITMMALGILAIAASTFATLVSVVFLGAMILFGGFVVLFDTFSFWRNKKRSGFFVHLLLAVLYIGVGLMLVANPMEGSISITFLLGIFYIIAGVFRVSMSLAIPMPRWGWGWVNGVITLILGVLILMSWPASSLFIIGLFIGVDLFFYGLGYITLALAARKQQA